MLHTNVRTNRRSVLVAGLLLAAVLCGGAPAHAQKASGADIKAAFIFNFTKFVEWPAEQLPEGHPLIVAVIGDDRLADALTVIANGKQVQGHAVSVRRLTSVDDAARSHVLFVGSGEHARIAAVIKRLESGNVLTISDASRFCHLGGVIEFFTEADRIRFDVNLQNANTAGLAINSKLLALARTVHPSAKAQ